MDKVELSGDGWKRRSTLLEQVDAEASTCSASWKYFLRFRVFEAQKIGGKSK
jgi:hypothetical protein